MAKYYVQSGTLKMIVHAAEADRAALWAVHQVLSQVLPVFDDEAFSPREKQSVAAVHGHLVLDEDIRLSEQGFDRDDANVFHTGDVVTEWSQLVIALQKIERLTQAGEASPALCSAV